MAPNVRSNLLSYVVFSFLLCTLLYRHYLRPSASLSPAIISFSSTANFAIHENFNLTQGSRIIPPSSSPSPSLSTTAVLLPDWEILVIVSPEMTPKNILHGYLCLFETGEKSPATFAGMLPFPDRATFICPMQRKIRLKRPPVKQPVLLKYPDKESAEAAVMAPLLRWSYLVYDSLTTVDDVVLFVKGIHNRQGVNRPPTDFRCWFADGSRNRVSTRVTSSAQEVIRCKRPQPPSALTGDIKVSVEIIADKRMLPSVAYYTQPRTLAHTGRKSLLCAVTVVYNVTKILEEWILYHSKIGVEKFLLYDNGSDDNLQAAVDHLLRQGIDVQTYPWRWPKTQESGFSHSVLYAKKSCTWMMYMDVDEFVFSPSWLNLSNPSELLLQRVITSNSLKQRGQITIGCHEFGPSGQKAHPSAGVTQGYDCRRRVQNRHKSMVLLDAVDESLMNAIHHFELKKGYETRKVSTRSLVVNHYKYQAWPEFRAKFRRRVSAYVLDWTQKLNPNSKDRAPGLGFEAVEPAGWAQRFCEMRDGNLKELVRKWFQVESNSGIVGMPWERR